MIVLLSPFVYTYCGFCSDGCQTSLLRQLATGWYGRSRKSIACLFLALDQCNVPWHNAIDQMHNHHNWSYCWEWLSINCVGRFHNLLMEEHWLPTHCRYWASLSHFQELCPDDNAVQRYFSVILISLYTSADWIYTHLTLCSRIWSLKRLESSQHAWPVYFALGMVCYAIDHQILIIKSMNWAVYWTMMHRNRTHNFISRYIHISCLSSSIIIILDMS